jgi:hypothetical protein
MTEWNRYANPQTTAYEVDLRAFTAATPTGTFTFKPQGTVNREDDENNLPNPIAWDDKTPMLSARLFVGLNIGKRKVEDVIKIVKRVRTDQTGNPSASFLWQKGIYQHDVSGDVDSVQVVILNLKFLKTSAKKFQAQMVELAEKLAKKLKQESVIVEIQRGGRQVRTFGVSP